MRLCVWDGPGRDHDYGREMDDSDFVAVMELGEEDRSRVGGLAVGEMIHGKDAHTGRPWTVRRTS